MRQRKTDSPPVENRFESVEPAALNPVETETLIKLVQRLLAERHRAGHALESPEQTRTFLRLKLMDRKHEVFGALFLDNRHRIIEVAEMFQGTIDGASVYPRVVVQRALEVNAAAIVFFHNHPSGVAEPSTADAAITRRLREALSLVDIRVLDHFVVAAGESVSFAERGLL
jgi:DNA repair protein RadC